jgi:hypothetical protein
MVAADESKNIYYLVNFIDLFSGVFLGFFTNKPA